MHPVHTLPPYFFNMHSNTKLSSKPSSSMLFSFLLGLNQILVCTSLLSYACHIHRPSRNLFSTYTFCSVQASHFVKQCICSAVSCFNPRPRTRKAQDLYKPSPRGMCNVKIYIATGLSPSTWVFPCQYHSTSAPYSFFLLSLKLYTISI